MVDLPNWSQIDASRAPSLPEHAERPGRLVVVLTTADARADGSAAETTISMVAAWSAEGRRVVLADVGLDQPTLHAAVAAPNAEGVGDVVLFCQCANREGALVLMAYAHLSGRVRLALSLAGCLRE